MTYLQNYVIPVKSDVNVKVINMIANRKEAKTMVKHISSACKFKINSITWNSNQKME